MQVYHNSAANLDLLTSRQIAIIGYGNQGRTQALNLCNKRTNPTPLSGKRR